MRHGAVAREGCQIGAGVPRPIALLHSALLIESNADQFRSGTLADSRKYLRVMAWEVDVSLVRCGSKQFSAFVHKSESN